MWLPETAVNDFVLRVLAEEGIRFTILAPGQIEADEPPRSGLYRWRDPEDPDRTVDLVVYDARLAHTLAFEVPSSRQILGAALDVGGLVIAATDGETFGHHHDGADEVVARALSVAEPSYGVRVPRLIDLLDESPPRVDVRVRTSAWSCAHGVQRWMADCGCHTGGREGWNQGWRGPLRRALDVLRDWGVDVFERRGKELLREPWAARDEYLGLLIGAMGWDEFARRHIVGDGHQAGVLLDAQRNALLMYTSCGWFFNDLAGIETVQVLRYAARSIDLHQQIGEQPPVDAFLDALAEARSNDPEQGDGRDLWFSQVVTH
jgi:alpha-amylase/alpha-mannosidase (GH57 family)